MNILDNEWEYLYQIIRELERHIWALRPKDGEQAQEKKEWEGEKCGCGLSWLIKHRFDGPCYHFEQPEPPEEKKECACKNEKPDWKAHSQFICSQHTVESGYCGYHIITKPKPSECKCSGKHPFHATCCVCQAFCSCHISDAIKQPSEVYEWKSYGHCKICGKISPKDDHKNCDPVEEKIKEIGNFFCTYNPELIQKELRALVALAKGMK